jgi:hypothetical protein
MRSPFRARLRCGFLLTLLLGVLQVGAQDYEAQFVKGIMAMGRESWHEAISYFRAAIAGRPRESTVLVQFSGMRTMPYLPRFYLGMAYAGSGNCAAALEEFAESERQGVVQKSGEYKNLLKLREKCRGSAARVTTPGSVEIASPPESAAVVPAPPTPVAVVAPSSQMPLPSPTEDGLAAQSLRDAQTEVARAAAGAILEARLRETSVDSESWRKEPSLEARHKKATDDLAAARAALEEGKARGDVSRLREARDIAVRASQEFDELRRLLLAARLTVVPPPLPRDISLGINDARQLLAETGRSPSLPAEAAGARVRLEALLEGAQKLDSATPLEQKAFDSRLKSAMRRLSNSLKATPPPRVATALPQFAAKVPTPLFEGAKAYLSGDYARAARTLEPIPDFNDQHAVAVAMLIRSAARYALFVIGGKKDSGLEQKARRDVSDCRRLDPQVSPKRRVFSPRFVEFFAGATDEPAHTAN